MILAIETATSVCSVALMAEDGTIYEKRESGKGIHSEKLFLFIEMLMNEHSFRIGDLNEILLSSGPGSYTGLRIGAAAVKGLLFRQETPLFLLGSLEAMAAGVLHTHPEVKRIHAVIDARRQHLYHQLFVVESEGLTGSDPVTTAITEIDKVIRPGDIVVGTGLERLEAFQQAAGAETSNATEGTTPVESGLTDPENKKSNAGAGIDSVVFPGELEISAVNLILARNSPRFNSRFEAAPPETFEPEYLSMG